MHPGNPEIDVYIGEIRLFSYARLPLGWLPADGRRLSVNHFIALFSLIGTTYGGDGEKEFALPTLESPAPGLQYCIAVGGVFPRLQD
ncbi:phage tail protein [Azospirillum argentinense]|uniref:Tail fiber protein n=3 Tax=Azospirillum TaxID=191 RepID=A0A4D8PR79_AZOBR|nr:tail fiber protein [Azospirillum argentinense]QCO15819.1 tail fiber protein [Azospirillum brasilense]KAA1056208.1 Microcystin dependent protein [Azospirillum argentinense]MBK3803758.1 tail fiber protein [Azospirillum argentinense]PNQ97813.1 phage tail protein [Azospirillum argentinense]QCO00934.1 tail fiber protein [Azospirillum argentinense]